MRRGNDVLASMNTMTEPQSAYIDAARAAALRLPGREAPWVSRIRSEALDRFVKTGFPTPRDEEWKYTNVAPISRQVFTPVSPDRQCVLAVGQLDQVLFGELQAYRAVFVDGLFNEGLSNLGGLPDGASVTGLAQTLEHDAPGIEPFLDRDVVVRDHGFAALNAAFLADGAIVRIAEGVVVPRPIYLLFLTTAHSDSLLITPHNLIVAEAGSQATVIEHYGALGDAMYLTDAVTQVLTKRNAGIEYYRVQQESTRAYHIGGIYVRQDRESRFTSHTVDLGGLLVRNELKITLEGERAECELNGLYIVDGRRHVDNHTFVDHAQPRCTSDEFYKGVVDGRGRAVFSGRVLVRPNAQHTDAGQLNKNLLLSRDAEVDTKPQLEIYADDVKCSHGAAVGQLDTNALFYLRSRGMDEAAARSLLTYAFANDVLRRFKLSPVRRALEEKLTSRLLVDWATEELELI